MKKNYKHIIVLVAVLVGGCVSQVHVVKINNTEYKVDAPPGTVQISPNFYVDETEISNIEYLEYVFWTERTYKDSEKLYTNILSDSLENYFKHPAFQNYPVVGISYEQAVSYCKWRSDRVFEKILVDEGIFKYNPNQNKDNHFTIERYFSGLFADSVPIVKNIPYPEYRLPTKEEWEKAALGGLDSTFIFGYDFNSKQFSKLSPQNKIFNTADYYTYHNNYLKYITHPTEFSFPATLLPDFSRKPANANNYGLYEMIGNVSEMTAEKGLAKGGSWQHTLYDCNIFNDIQYTEPSLNLGFRCVCEWKLPE